jgi:hypothetical protein
MNLFLLSLFLSLLTVPSPLFLWSVRVFLTSRYAVKLYNHQLHCYTA